MGESVWSSPALVGKHVYLTTAGGTTRVFPLAEHYEQAKQAILGAGVHATPAFGDGCVYVRAEGDLFCIGRPGTGAR